MTEAIASSDNRLMAKRIDDSNSVIFASQRRSVFSCNPSVLVFISVGFLPDIGRIRKTLTSYFKKQKGRHSPPPYSIFSMPLVLDLITSSQPHSRRLPKKQQQTNKKQKQTKTDCFCARRNGN